MPRRRVCDLNEPVGIIVSQLRDVAIALGDRKKVARFSVKNPLLAILKNKRPGCRTVK